MIEDDKNIVHTFTVSYYKVYNHKEIIMNSFISGRGITSRSNDRNWDPYDSGITL